MPTLSVPPHNGPSLQSLFTIPALDLITQTDCSVRARSPSPAVEIRSFLFRIFYLKFNLKCIKYYVKYTIDKKYREFKFLVQEIYCVRNY